MEGQSSKKGKKRAQSKRLNYVTCQPPLSGQAAPKGKIEGTMERKGRVCDSLGQAGELERDKTKLGERERGSQNPPSRESMRNQREYGGKKP